MTSPSAEIERLRAALAARDARLADVEAELKSRDLLIEKLKHQLAGMQRHRFGASSEALDQLELRLEDEEISAAAERPVPADPPDAGKGVAKRRPLPDHLPREEQVLTPGDACAACGGKLRRLGDDVTDELEYRPGRFVVNRIVRPRMACSRLASGSCRPPFRRARSNAGVPVPGCWPMYWCPNTRIACRCIARAGSSNATESTWGVPPSPTGWAASQHCWSRWPTRSASMCGPAMRSSPTIPR